MPRTLSKSNGAALTVHELAPEEQEVMPVMPQKGRGRKSADVVQIKMPEFAEMKIRVYGTADLLVHKFSEKAKQQLLAKHMKEVRAVREAKVPFDDFKGSLHVMPGREAFVNKLPKLKTGESWKFFKDTFCFPTSGFKKAMLTATKLIEGVSRPMVALNIRLLGYETPLVYEKLRMHQAMVRVGNFPNKVPDVRFRGCFEGWSAELHVRYNTAFFNKEQIAALVEYSGQVGLGENRPEKEGELGTFTAQKQ